VDFGHRGPPLVRPALAASVNDSAYRFGPPLTCVPGRERSPHTSRYTQRYEPGQATGAGVMSWPKRFYSCAWPDVEAADAWELTGPGRPVARDPRGYASAVCRFGCRRGRGPLPTPSASPTPQSTRSSQQAPWHRTASCCCAIMWQTHRTARLRGHLHAWWCRACN
jgi:hypothetical protein